jgi:hypothetical protein
MKSLMARFCPPRARCTSSTLTRLNISVGSFDACLYLLDGRFECLSTLIIEITANIDRYSSRENYVSRNSMNIVVKRLI